MILSIVYLTLVWVREQGLQNLYQWYSNNDIGEECWMCWWQTSPLCHQYSQLFNNIELPTSTVADVALENISELDCFARIYTSCIAYSSLVEFLWALIYQNFHFFGRKYL